MKKVIYSALFLFCLALGPVIAIFGLLAQMYAFTAFGVVWFLGLLGKFVSGYIAGKEFAAKMATYKQQGYDWYKATHPTHVHGNGVSCHSCGGRRINVRSLMKRTYTRAHFCTQCGTTLYYSPETDAGGTQW